MSITLSVEDTTCIRCGHCVRICPSIIFTQNNPNAPIGLQNIHTCISCGHCVGVCPTDSVIHSEFPTDRVHKIDRKLLPSPEQVMLLCKARRSNRAFTDRPVPVEKLELILEAAHRAPTASNRQEVSFTVITDREKLRQVSDFTIGVFASLAQKLENPLLKPLIKMAVPQAYRYLPVFKRLRREYENGNDLILRGATALIFIHTPKENRFGCQDANLAYQNGSLMAESLGVSQFYTGFVCTADVQEKKGSLARILGINGKIHAGMALGLPDFRFVNYIDKKDLKAQWL